MTIANKRMSGKTVLGLLLAGTVLVSQPAEAGDKPSLRIEKKTQAASLTEQGTTEVTYTLLNTSNKTITSWDFTCVTVTQGGTSALGSILHDVYRSYALPGLRSVESIENHDDGAIRPGERIVQTVKIIPGELDGPLAAKSCAPVMVIFADASFEGDSALARERFDKRAAQAVLARKAFDRLQRDLDSGMAPEKALNRLVEGDEKDGPALSIAREATQQDGASIEAFDLLEELHTHYLAALAHLPEEWQERVAKETEP